ncbi:MAG TPA: helix-turn-helix domain-containing protein [Caulobacteraceae bacterium]|jgi:DNA-binding HxlR family transcriptional regulator|nr:helix-turn-helix domain-containing protein [Caulobacteraceae bacterium]
MGAQSCPAELTLRLISGRWKPLVIHWLLPGPTRFNALQRHLGAITHRTLSKTLKEMEADGLIARRDHGEIPPRVDYTLTALGASLEPVLQAMHQWALEHSGTPLPRERLSSPPGGEGPRSGGGGSVPTART